MPKESELYNFLFPEDLLKKRACAKKLESVLFRHRVEMNAKGSRVRGVKGSSALLKEGILLNHLLNCFLLCIT